MVVYFITGTSSGLGKAIAEEVLADKQTVVGIGRRHTIEADHYHPVQIDLSDLDVTDDFGFEIPENKDAVDKVVLINNAGMIEPVKHLGNTDKASIQKHFNVNLLAPAVLMNNFLNAFEHVKAEKVIINVSTGAADRPMDGWSCYGSSKAGLNMASAVVDAEAKMDNRNCRVYALAPGIVDTPMQDSIRSADETEFSRLKDFQAFKANDLLLEPKAVAKKFIKVVNEPTLDLHVVDRLN